MKDSFGTANKIKATYSATIFDNGYGYVSIDVESLFTDAPMERKVNITLNWIYNDQLISTNLKKRNLKKFCINTCKKTAALSIIWFMSRKVESAWGHHCDKCWL